MKFVVESLESLLKPRGAEEVINMIKNLPIKEQIEKIKQMQSKWGDMYKNLLNNKQIKDELTKNVKEELSKYDDVISKLNAVERLENDLPDLFKELKDDKLLKEIKEYIQKQDDFNTKVSLLWRFFKSWPSLFKDIEDDPLTDKETNQLMILFKIKGAIDDNNIEKIQKFVRELGEKYGRKNILDKASSILIPNYGGYSNSRNLFNIKDIEQLKISLFKETRSEEELVRDEYYDVYAFIGYDDYIDVDIKGENYSKKRLGIENLVKIDKYDSNSLKQVPMMNIRARSQGENYKVYGVYIPKFMWDKNHVYNDDIPDKLRSFIDENKFNF